MSEPLRLTVDDVKSVWLTICSAEESVLVGIFGMTDRATQFGYAMFALGCARQRERDAEYMRTTFGRCNLLTANGYMEGSDVASVIEAQGGEKP